MAKSSVNWKNHFIELIVVIFGITIAFGIENYAAHRKEKAEELMHLRGIADDLQTDIRLLDEFIGYNENTVKYVVRFNELVSRNDPKTDSLNWLLMRAGWISSHDPRDISYQSLKTSGGLDKVSNFELRKMIVYHYEQKTSQARFLNEMHANSLRDDIQPALLRYADFTQDERIDPSFFKERTNKNLFAGLEGLLKNKIDEYKELKGFTSEILAEIEAEIGRF